MTIKSAKVQLAVFLALFALYLSFTGRDAMFLSTLCVSLVAAVAADSFITYLKTRKFAVTESSIVSGLIVGYVMSSDQAWWMTALASVFAISSKHLIRFKTRHIFNPAGFGVIIAVFLLGASTEWKGAYLWYIIIPFGAYFVFKIRKQEIAAGYLIASFILFGGQAVINRVNISGIWGYLNYFFIFIMLIEPMTTPAAYRGKIIFGSGAGALIFVLYLFGIREAELLALLFFNLFTPLLSKKTVRQ